MSFIHLHVHSHYSLLDGLSKIDELIAKAKEYKMPALALTDHGVMYGVIEFYRKAKEAGIKPIIGVEVYVARNGRFQKRPRIDEKPYHLVLLAKNQQGYQNLIKLTAKAHLEGFYYKPRVDWELLEKYSAGLIALTACLQGEIPQAILTGTSEEKIKEIFLKYQKNFGEDNFYLEVQDHPNSKEQILVNKMLFSLGKKYNIPLVATNDVHYLNSGDAEAQDVLLCIQTKKKKGDKDRLNMLGDDFSLHSSKQMFESFKNCPEAINNTKKIADVCNLEIELGNIKLPYFELPEGKTANEYLGELCLEGLEKKYKGFPNQKEIKERLEYELKVIQKTGFAPYFLIVQDFVNWSKKNNIVVGPGRGSVAGSIVSYLLDITSIEPLGYNLIFERFLNPDRISMPDIDLDFADTRRDEVIDYVTEKYGRDHVSQIITFGTMAARAAVRDVGRVLDFPYNFCDRIAKLIPMFTNLEKALDTVNELKELYQTDPGAKKIIDMAKKLEGVARHASTHACGVVITPQPLDYYLPLQRASSSDKTVVSQYEMNSIEALGLLKMDFLGLKNLTVLENAIKKIKQSKGIEIDINKIPLDDKKVFKLLQKGETTGVFQLESSGMRRYLKQLRPTGLEDIIAMISLYRPGPIQFLPQYIAGKQGKIKIKYLHPKLKPILEKTYGICIYQEQLLQIARDLAGFSLSEADILRKAVGKKIRKLLAKQRTKFIQGCIKNSIQKETAEKIFAFIEPFAGYGFNLAHGTCYATIAYQTAYLKANYPTEFMAALLISDQRDLDRIAIEVEECRQMGIKVLPPDINESFEDFTVVMETEKPTIRFGLLTIKNVGHHIVRVIIQERENNGPYQNLEDLLRRVRDKDLNKKSLESLIKSGALDKFGERGQMLYNTEQLLAYTKMVQKEKLNEQKNLFGAFSKEMVSSLNLKPTQSTSQKQKLSWEKELLGLYLSQHPMENLSPYLEKITVPCSQVSCQVREVRTAGIITKIKKVITKNNEIMLFVKIEDAFGNIETMVFPSLLKKSYSIWQEEKIVIVFGRPSNKDGSIKIIANDVFEINENNIEDIRNKLINEDGDSSLTKLNKPQSETQITKITLSFDFLKDPEKIKKIKNTFKEFPGQSVVYLLIQDENGMITKKIKTNFFIDPKQQFKEEIEKIISQNSVKKR